MMIFQTLVVAVSMVIAVCSDATTETCMEELTAIKERLDKLERTSSPSRRLVLSEVPDFRIAFYTQLSKDVSHIGNHQTIMFDTVTTNVGNGYNRVDGIFTAPVSGTYVFFWLNTNKDHSYMNTELVKNGSVMGKSMSDAMDHADYAASSNNAVLRLQQGEKVWVRSGTWHSGIIAGDFYSTFSGWLLYED